LDESLAALACSVTIRLPYPNAAKTDVIEAESMLFSFMDEYQSTDFMQL